MDWPNGQPSADLKLLHPCEQERREIVSLFEEAENWPSLVFSTVVTLP